MSSLTCGDRVELAHLHFDVRFLVQAEHNQFRVNDESHALTWVPAVGLNALSDEESRMARKWVVCRDDGGERQALQVSQ